MDIQKKQFDFEDRSQGEVFGGNYPRLELEVNGVSSELVYVMDSYIELDDLQNKGQKKTHAIRIFSDEGGMLCSGPISAVFESNFLEAGVKIGDHIRIKRYGDMTKKGTQQVMKIHAVKIISRS